MRFGTLSLGFGMLGVGAMMQSTGIPYDLGEAVKPLEEFAAGAGKSAAAAAKAITGGAELPAWLLAFALVVLLVRVFFTSQATDKVMQGRNDARSQAHAIEMAKLLHAQEMEKMQLERERGPRHD